MPDGGGRCAVSRVLSAMKGSTRVAIVVASMSLAACEKATLQIHDLGGFEVSPMPGVQVAVSAGGRWETHVREGRTTHVNGSPYDIVVRVRGVRGQSVSIASFGITDPVTGATVAVNDWTDAVFSWSDSSYVIRDQSGVDLQRRSQTVVGELHIGEGTEAETYRLEGMLQYEYREEERNRFLEAIGGV